MNSQDLVTWSDDFSIDLPEVDRQHMSLFAAINRLWRAEIENLGVDIVEELLEELHDYTEGHFVAEEALMRMGGYPHLENHILSHRKFVEQISKAAEDAGEGKRVGMELLQFLNDWLINHIKITDRDYAKYLRAHQRRGIMDRFAKLYQGLATLIVANKDEPDELKAMPLEGMDMRQAIHSHMQWIERLTNLLEHDDEELDPDQIACHDRCFLGIWIKNHSAAGMSQLTEFTELDRDHRGFHLCAAEIVRRHQAGDSEAARRLLKRDLRRASNRVRLNIIRLFGTVQK